MGREIKFRAWDGTSFIKVEKLEFLDEGVNINDHLGIPYENLTQFTGLLDIKGVEIYEGDKVEWIKDGYNYTASIVFSDGGYIIDTEMILSEDVIKKYTLEVIGNIYETGGKK